jgi:hypothetical protein
VKVVLRPPAGAKKLAVDVPVVVSFGASSALAPQPAENDNLFGVTDIPNGDLTQSVGIDLLARVAPPGAALPRFFLPASAQVLVTDKPYPPHGTIPGPTLQQTVAITGCSTPVVGNPQAVTVAGAVDPPHGVETVHLTYTSGPGPVLPAGTVVSHDVSTDAAGGTFSDQLDRQGSPWSVVASLDEDELYSSAVSLPCAIPIP